MDDQKYLDGCASFVPASNDNPDCVPFYRAWRGIENVLGKETLSKFHHLLHEAICTGASFPLAGQYDAILKHARWIVERWKKPDEPRYSHSWTCEPAEPTEQDARGFFDQEFRRAFPGKRVNSKEANRLWSEKRDEAIRILREGYASRLAAYQADEARRDAENVKKREEWISQFEAMAQFENLIRDLVSVYPKQQAA